MTSHTVQVNQVIDLLKDVLGHSLLGVYLYGSSVLGGLQKYSDIDLFVVLERPTTDEEKRNLANRLLEISGVYMKESSLPLELTIVVKSEINPWHYPPHFDFQYGEWLRIQFESGNIQPWPNSEMPDLALLVTQIFLSSKTLLGINPDQLLAKVPYKDVITATRDSLPSLVSELNTDTRNVLLTLARIWSRITTDTERSKPTSADWAINRLPENYRPIMERAKSICIGEVSENWDDIKYLIQPCADFMLNQIIKQIALIESTGFENKSIYLDKREANE